MAATSFSALICGEALETEQLLHGEGVDVGGVLDEAAGDQLTDGAVAEALDVHRPA